MAHTLEVTMVYGKVCYALMKIRSAQTCYFCGAKPKEMNDITKDIKRPYNRKSVDYGLSILHAHLRIFECLLHKSYRLNLNMWHVR